MAAEAASCKLPPPGPGEQSGKLKVPDFQEFQIFEIRIYEVRLYLPWSTADKKVGFRETELPTSGRVLKTCLQPLNFLTGLA